MPYFFSNLSIYAYVNSNKLLIGNYLGMAEVAIYDLADKIISLLKQPQYIISQAVFPKIAREMKLKFVYKVGLFSILASIIICLVIFIFSNLLFEYIEIQRKFEVLYVLKILSITIPLITLSGIICNNIFIAFGFTKYFMVTIFSALLYYFFSSFFMIYTSNYNLNTAVWNNVIVEIVVLMLAIYLYIKNKNKFHLYV